MALNKTIWRDLDLNFINNPVTGDISKSIDKIAVIKSITNLVLTNHYERPFNPDIGSNVERLLFENLTPLVAASIQREIENTVTNSEPRVKIRYITVQANNDENGYDVIMEFYIINSIEPIAISLFLERVS